MIAPLIQMHPHYYIHPDYIEDIKALGIDTLEGIFAFTGGTSLAKQNLSTWRNRIELRLPKSGLRCFLKRYFQPPVRVQVKNWLSHRQRQLTAMYDALPCPVLNQAGVGTYQVLACGGQWKGLFEDRSFALLLEIPAAQSLEKQLPACFTQPTSPSINRQRTACIDLLADFVRRFHQTGYCHRDLYLCHIFYAANGTLSLIDLQRAFQPRWFRLRWIIKDLTQLYFSAPGDRINRTDRLRFYLRYSGTKQLSAKDRFIIRQIKRKAWAIADREIRNGKPVPFAN